MAWVLIKEYTDGGYNVQYQRDDTIGAHRLMVNSAAGAARSVKYPCRYGNSRTGDSWIAIAYDPHFLVAVENEFALDYTTTLPINDPIIARLERIDT